ncbi:putative hydrolase of the HAD superfamily [Saccharothrix tamanrassetensis]|uniref:Putative hydrolase of the HAD superfamily n=1 Tax=Saccharothrix tamanrassetensis TaxID=1051531 RepID=A0A841CCH9_9PSEU|nr:HAD-IA family hydrolase [Saccharothrix tamanrassetensis]MBB5955099.1 putative hydrolase of the HAD superfamily [Saccharothrix tamanrassetensis]
MTLLLLDLDGVLRRFGPDTAIEDRFGLPHGTLASVAFSLAGPALVGEVTDEEWRTALGARLSDEFGPDRAKNAVTAWSRVGEVVPEALALVRKVRSHHRVALFSNATTRLPEDLRRLGLDREVDDVVTSALIGAAKPTPEAFRRALGQLRVSADETVFCDDNAENAAGAVAVGIDGVHVPDVAALRAALADRGLLDG